MHAFAEEVTVFKFHAKKKFAQDAWEDQEYHEALLLHTMPQFGIDARMWKFRNLENHC
jgi:hypothetical protein